MRRARWRKFVLGESLEMRSLLAGDLVSEFALELGDFDANGELEISDLEALGEQLLAGPSDPKFDVDRDGTIDINDQRMWVDTLARTYLGDANFDGEFGTSDLVAVFQAGLYESDRPGEARWSSGDWNADGRFDTGDLVAAFQAGGFEVGRRSMAPLVISLEGDPLPGDFAATVVGENGQFSVTTQPYSVVTLEHQVTEVIGSAGDDGIVVFHEVPFDVGLNELTFVAEDLWGSQAQADFAVVRREADPYDYQPWGSFLKFELDEEFFVPSMATAYIPAELTRADILKEQMELGRTKPVAGRANFLTFQANVGLDETEAATQSGDNDTLVDAEPVGGFGTGLSEEGHVVVAGTLLPVPTLLSPQEDDGDITQPNETNLEPGQAILATGRVGDGPHGSLGSGSGDFDMFAVRNVLTGQTISVDVNTPSTSPLDSWVYIYNSEGVPVDVNDDFGVSTDSRLEFRAFEDGDYFVSISGYGTFGPVDATDSSSGIGAASEGDYEVVIGLEANSDVDMYSFELEAGDVFAAGVTGGGTKLTLFGPNGQPIFGSGQDASFIYAIDSPLPGGNATVSWVVDETGTYTIAVDQGVGAYELELFADRAGLVDESRGSQQILFLDFDGATIAPLDIFGLGRETATLDALTAFLPNWGLTPNDEAAVIEATRAAVEENFRDLGIIGVNGDYRGDGIDGNFGVEIVTSRDFVDAQGFPVDLFGQDNVSRVIVGGTIGQLGITTIGIAESIDVGNLNSSETAVVLLDLLSRPAGDVNSLNSIPLANSVSMIDLLGTAIGNVIAHEAGHFLGTWHTAPVNGINQLMDQGGDITRLVGVGPDGIFGSADDEDVDFGVDDLAPNEGFTGQQNSVSALSYGLSTGTVDGGLTLVESIPGRNRQVTVPPTEFVLRFSDPIGLELPSPDVLRVNGTGADSVSKTNDSELTFRFDESPVTIEGLQDMSLEASLTVRESDGASSTAETIQFGFDRQVMEVANFTPTPGDMQLPFGTLTVDFTEPIDAASVGPDDLVLNFGSVVTAEVVDNDTVAYTLDELTTEGVLEVQLLDGAVTDQFGNYGLGFYAEYDLEIGRVTFASSFEPRRPLGSLIYDPEMPGRINIAGDVDEFALRVDSGQSITVSLTPDSTLRGRVEVRQGNRTIATGEADAAGTRVLLQSDPLTGTLIRGGSEEFVVRVSGIDDSTGGYQLGLLLNTAVEEEYVTAIANDSAEAAQTLAPAFRTFQGNDSEQASVLGALRGELVAREDFESGGLGNDWTTTHSTPQGRIQVTGDFSTSDGDFALVMDVSERLTPNLNEAVWTVNLADRDSAILTFDHVSFSDEGQSFQGPFVGSFAADGIAISSNGENWFPIFNSPDTAFAQWNHFELDLFDAATRVGLDLSEPLQIKFQQFDDFPLARDGRGWDNIRINENDPADWYRVNLSRDDVATIIATSQSTAEQLEVELYDVSGQRVAIGLQSTDNVTNGSFETGSLSGWQTQTTGEMLEPWAVAGAGGAGNRFIDFAEPQDGRFVAWTGFDGNGPLETVLYQDITIPADAEQAVIAWQHRVQWFYVENNAAPRRLELQIRDAISDAIVDTLYTFATPPGDESRLGDSGWSDANVDLGSYRGQTVRLAFVAVVPDAYVGPGQVEIDAVRIDFGDREYPNVTDAITSYQVPETDEYFVRVVGSNDAEYSLSVLRNVGFDLQADDETSIPLEGPLANGRRWQLGYIDETSGPDRYEIKLARRPVSIEIFSPAGSDGEFENLLNAVIRLYDPNGNLVAESEASDGQGEIVTLSYQADGTIDEPFTLEISGTPGPGASGEYLMSVRGADTSAELAETLDLALDGILLNDVDEETLSEIAS